MRIFRALVAQETVLGRCFDEIERGLDGRFPLLARL